MGRNSAPRLSRFLPQIAVATFLVAVLPALVVWTLGATGTVTSMLPLIAVGIVLSLLFGWVGRVYWETRPGSSELVFGELLVWGFVSRTLAERRLSSAVELFHRTDGANATDLSAERHRRLLEDLVDSLEARDPYTNRHSRRVARYSAIMAKRLGFNRNEVAAVRAAAALHDVGKILTPPAVLQKRGALTDEEYAVVKRHALDGARMVHSRVDERYAMMIAHHHERLDGTGYPAGASGRNIPMGARIIAVADTFDALTSRRPYRPAQTHRQAFETLRQEAGTRLDADCVRAFRSYYSGLRPLTGWAFALSIPNRFFAPIAERVGAAAGGALPATQIVATAVTTATMAGAVATGPQLFDESPVSTAAEQTLASAQVPEGAGGEGLDEGLDGGPGRGTSPGGIDGTVGVPPGGGDSPTDGGSGGGSGDGSSTGGGSGTTPPSDSGGSGGGGGADLPSTSVPTSGGGGSLGNTVNEVGDTVNGTVGNVGNTVDNTVNGVGSTVNGTVNGVGNLVGGLLKPKPPKN